MLISIKINYIKKTERNSRTEKYNNQNKNSLDRFSSRFEPA